jgi:hypothetical protein
VLTAVSWYELSRTRYPAYPVGLVMRSGRPPIWIVPKLRSAVSWTLPFCPLTAVRFANVVIAADGAPTDTIVASPRSVANPWKCPTTRDVPACWA